MSDLSPLQQKKTMKWTDQCLDCCSQFSLSVFNKKKPNKQASKRLYQKRESLHIFTKLSILVKRKSEEKKNKKKTNEEKKNVLTKFK